MAFEVGDIWPYTSGTSALGAEITNGGFAGEIRPFASIHQNSGVWHDLSGQSGVVRFTIGAEKISGSDIYGLYPGFEFSTNGGDRYLLKIGGILGSGTNIPNGVAIIEALRASQLRLSGSGIQVNSNGSVIFNIDGNELHNVTRGAFAISSASLTENITGSVSVSANSVGHSIVNDFSATSALGNINFETQDATDGVGNFVINMLGDLQMDLFNHSGIMNYRFGPYQSFYIKTSITSTGGPFNDGFWPIVTSGNVNEMINRVTDFDIAPAASGRYRLGYDEVVPKFKPYASVHMNSGVFHNPLHGNSGIIRMQASQDSLNNGSSDFNKFFGFSFDGGIKYSLEFGASHLGLGDGVFLGAPLGGLQCRSSGDMAFVSLFGSMNFITSAANSDIFFGTAGNNSFVTIESVGYILPRTSGTAFLGYKQAQNTSDIRPFASIHQNSGVFHSPTGNSGIMRFRQLLNVDGLTVDGFEFSCNGGQDYHMRIGGGGTTYGVIEPDGSKMLIIRGSGVLMNAIGNITISARRQTGIGAQLGVIDFMAFSNMNAHAASINLFSVSSDIVLGPQQKTILGSTGSDSPVNMSGLFNAPISDHVLGDMFMMSHSVTSGIIGTTTTAVAKAKALGVGTLGLNTGSGIANISIGSGIAQFANGTAQPLNTALTNLSIDSIVECADQNYGVGSIQANTSGIITVFSPGLYKISYKVQASKTVGSTAQNCVFRLEKNSSGSALAGSICNTMHVDATNASDCSTYNTILINLDAGDTIRIRGSSTLSGANNCTLLARGAVIVIEKIGPKRGIAGS